MNSLTYYNSAIVGAQGYTGLELARLLVAHPYAKLSAVFSRDPYWQLQDELPIASKMAIPTYALDTLLTCAHEFDCIFLATPPTISMEIAADLLSKGVHVIDLSGAFRLPLDAYVNWYGEQHLSPALIDKAHYGLCPWWTPPEPAHNLLISNPGCYASNALMVLIPLLKQALISVETIVIDAKSGVSGAGKKADTQLIYGEIAENFYPYKIGRHQHTPEISRYLQIFGGQRCSPLLSTHLLPLKRGLAVSIYARPNATCSDNDIEQAVSHAYIQAYEHYPLVRHQALEGLSAAKSRQLTSLQYVNGTPYTHITYKAQNGWLMLFGVLDNLMKGAASQAIENFNLLFKLPLTTGLLSESETL